MTSGQQDGRDEDAGEQRAHRLPNRPPAARVLVDGGTEPLLAEVGPEGVVEDELGVGRLPEQEVRDPLLARGPDHEVGICELGRVEMRSHCLLGNVVGDTPADTSWRAASTSSARPP